MERYAIHKVIGKDVNIAIPISKSITQVGLSETIKDLVEKETQNKINPYQDDEQIAYRSTDINGFNINFRFYDKQTNTFQLNYQAAGFNTTSGLTNSSFTKSFFRLYFYDSNELQNRDLVLFEEFDVIGTTQPTVNLKRLYWFRNDLEFNETTNNKTFYVIGRFFNALTGKVHDFMNLPLTYTSPITITDYSQNNDWWSSPVLLINPKNNNGNYNFTVLPFVGANGGSTITLTEQVIL
jgi:hypothetical protein